MIRSRPVPTALAALAVGAVMTTLSAAPQANASPGHVGRGGHSATSKPIVDTLTGIAVTSRTNAWAVGSSSHNPNAFSSITLIEHWNGRKWTTTPSPSPGGSAATDELASVSASSVTNAWAVGSFQMKGAAGPLAVHWNGHRWRLTPTASLGTEDASFEGVTVISASNAWAVGSYTVGTGPRRTLIEHWNGTKWRRFLSPSPQGDDALSAVTAVSRGDIWAVGDDFTGGVTGDTDTTLVEHWDGSSWKQVPSPNPGGTGDSHFNAVSAVSARDVWAVGSFNTDPQDNGPHMSLTEHWNGSSWKVIQSPNPTFEGDELTGVAATSPKNAWATGHFFAGSRSLRLVEHWNGTKWKTTPIKISAAPGLELESADIAALSRSDAWAVGDIANFPLNSVIQTWIEHWNGRQWTRSPSPNP